MERPIKKLERARQRPVIRSQPFVRESEEKDRKIASVRNLTPNQGFPAVSKEECGPSLTVELKDLSNSMGRMALDQILIWEELLRQKLAFENELNDAEEVPGQKGALSTVREALDVVFDDDNDIDFVLHAVEERKSYEATGDNKAGFWPANATPKEAVDDLYG